MNTTVSTSTRLRYALAERGVTSGRELASYLGCPAELYFIRGSSDDWSDCRAELRFKEDGRRQKRVYRPVTGGDRRDLVQECLDQAKADASEHLGIESWSRTPFSNCWLPSDDVSRVHEEFDNFEE